MSETGDMWKAVKEDRQRKGESNRAVSSQSFFTAVKMAHEHGLALVRHTDVHYSLRHTASGWRLDIYPGNQRVRKLGKAYAPFMNLRSPWTVLDVVRGAIEAGRPPKEEE